MDADGKNITLLTQNDRDLTPAWSPDGQRIAFSSNRDGDRDIYVMDADGKNITQLTQRQRHGLGSVVVARRPTHRIRVRPRRIHRDLCHGCRRKKHNPTHTNRPRPPQPLSVVVARRPTHRIRPYGWRLNIYVMVLD